MGNPKNTTNNPESDEIEQTEYIEELQQKVHALQQENTELRKQLNILEETRNRLGQLSEIQGKLSRISRKLNTLDSDQFMEVCTEKIPRFMNVRFASLYLYNNEEHKLVLQSDNHPEEIEQEIYLEEHQHILMNIALKKGEILLINDFDQFQKQHDINLDRAFASKYATQSCAVIPLEVGDEVLGVYNLADKKDSGQFSKTLDLPVMEQLRPLIGVTLSNWWEFRKKEKQARMDGLTGLANYRYFKTELNQEISRADRYDRPLSLMMIDLDNFKAINDEHGHLAGDHYLKSAAKQLSSSIRSQDFVARYGGDEFAVILPETDLEGACVAAQRIKDLQSKLTVTWEEQDLTTTFSIGIASYEHHENVQKLLEQADQALYQSKIQGKNKITLADAEFDHEKNE